jgi:drug/metabolite transporter (DMT)-like permease
MDTPRAARRSLVDIVKTSAPALFCGILVFYSASWVLSGIILASAPPLWSVVLRLVASLAAVCAINALGGGFLPLERARERAGALILLAFLGFAVFFTTTYLALRYLQPSQLVLALSLIPGITYFIGLIALGERHTWASTAGIAVSTAAVFLFAAPSLQALTEGGLVGLAFALTAAIGYALYGALYQKRLSGLPVLGVLPYLLGASAAMVAVVALAVEGAPSGFSARDAAGLLVIGAFLAAPIYVMYNQLIVGHGALLASLISVAAPMLTLSLETAIGLRPTIGLVEIAIAVLGSAGVALVIFDRSRRTRQ